MMSEIRDLFEMVKKANDLQWKQRLMVFLEQLVKELEDEDRRNHSLPERT